MIEAFLALAIGTLAEEFEPRDCHMMAEARVGLGANDFEIETEDRASTQYQLKLDNDQIIVVNQAGETLYACHRPTLSVRVRGETIGAQIDGVLVCGGPTGAFNVNLRTNVASEYDPGSSAPELASTDLSNPPTLRVGICEVDTAE